MAETKTITLTEEELYCVINVVFEEAWRAGQEGSRSDMEFFTKLWRKLKGQR